MSGPVYNVAEIHVVHIDYPIGGERWVQLQFHHAGSDSPLLVQLPAREWVKACLKSAQVE